VAPEPVRPEPSDRIAETVGAAEPAKTTRIATVETETLSITIERPGKPAAQASMTPGKASAGTSAATPEGQQMPSGGIVHVVVRGDTLWDISRRYLGNPFRYPELVRLSGIKNANLIHPGDVVRIRVNNQRR
jgi:nucleoid-associated protein YgaU